MPKWTQGELTAEAYNVFGMLVDLRRELIAHDALLIAASIERTSANNDRRGTGWPQLVVDALGFRAGFAAVVDVTLDGLIRGYDITWRGSNTKHLEPGVTWHADVKAAAEVILKRFTAANAVRRLGG